MWTKSSPIIVAASFTTSVVIDTINAEENNIQEAGTVKSGLSVK
jgi:hypothetical protein